MTSPKVSVILPVYNAERYVREAVESILTQTFADFELLAIDDASTDSSLAILQSFEKDPRVRIIRHTENRRLIATLNEGIELARGQYIARMDADDVSDPRRFEKQVQHLDTSPEVGVCGSWFRYIGRPVVIQPPADDDGIRLEMLFSNPIGHPTVMFRKSLLEKTGLRYSNDQQHIEDYALWMALASKTRFAVIPEILLDYRIHGDQISSLHAPVQAYKNYVLQQQYMEDLFGKESAVARAFQELRNKMGTFNSVDPALASRFVKELISANQKSRRFDEAVLEKFLFERVCQPALDTTGPLSLRFYQLMRKQFPSYVSEKEIYRLAFIHCIKATLRLLWMERLWDKAKVLRWKLLGKGS